mmetsp:Transcript_75494/g.214682  ORF Transcript_75494/g.214682 Transcript_75494/m.214682 type:complete len:201 (-) Transcript_75494:498-1100(-)
MVVTVSVLILDDGPRRLRTEVGPAVVHNEAATLPFDASRARTIYARKWLRERVVSLLESIEAFVDPYQRGLTLLPLEHGAGDVAEPIYLSLNPPLAHHVARRRPRTERCLQTESSFDLLHRAGRVAGPLHVLRIQQTNLRLELDSALAGRFVCLSLPRLSLEDKVRVPILVNHTCLGHHAVPFVHLLAQGPQLVLGFQVR